MCKSDYFCVIRRYGWYVTTLHRNTKAVKSWFRDHVGPARAGYTIEYAQTAGDTRAAVGFKAPADIEDRMDHFFPTRQTTEHYS